ncbi:MAG: hypothetical protein QNM02_05085 [Acidimicrobiia bacterium]|nr:hypothetical protein [Acidimicrobiia bacterium]
MATVIIVVEEEPLDRTTAGAAVVGIVSCVEIVSFPDDVQAIVPSIDAASNVIMPRRLPLLIHPFSRVGVGSKDPLSRDDDGGVTIQLSSTPSTHGTFPVTNRLPIPDGPSAPSEAM